MHLARPTAPRLEPIPAVAEKAREAMKSQPINAVNVTATMAHNRTMSKAIGKFAQTVLFDGELPRRRVEVAVLRMGWNCQAVYEFGQHTLFGRAAGLSDDERSTSRPAPWPKGHGRKPTGPSSNSSTTSTPTTASAMRVGRRPRATSVALTSSISSRRRGVTEW
jgi:hypothetical protein